MKVERCPSVHYRFRLGLSITFAFLVISLPIVISVNPALAKTASAPASSMPLPTTSTIPSAPSTIGQDGKGGEFTTQAALSSLTARPTNNIVNTNSFYDVVFLAATPGAIKTIQVTFPAGTTIPTGAFFNEAEKCVPGSNCTVLTGTASKSGQTITYTVTNAVNVPAGTKIRLEFANINNPLNPSASYKVTVTTRNAANAIIDGPTQSTAYTIKQIGKNAVAGSFMKRVTVLDNDAGHAVGWDPNGVATVFEIDEQALTGINESLVSISLRGQGGIDIPVCGVFEYGIGFFELVCTAAASDGAELHYVVENLPAHVVQ